MARNFDGINDYYELTDSSDLSLPNGDWTISLWLYYEDSGNSFAYPLSHGSLSNENSINLYIVQADDKIRFTIGKGNGNGSFFLQTNNGTLTLNSWNHIVGRRTGNTFEIYINGSFSIDFNPSLTWSSSNPTGNMFLGGRSDLTTTRFFKGRLCEFSKWDRALSLDEINALSEDFSPLHFINDLVIYQPLIDSLHEIISSTQTTNAGTTEIDHRPIKKVY